MQCFGCSNSKSVFSQSSPMSGGSSATHRGSTASQAPCSACRKSRGGRQCAPTSRGRCATVLIVRRSAVPKCRARALGDRIEKNLEQKGATTTPEREACDSGRRATQSAGRRCVFENTRRTLQSGPYRVEHIDGKRAQHAAHGRLQKLTRNVTYGDVSAVAIAINDRCSQPLATSSIPSAKWCSLAILIFCNASDLHQKSNCYCYAPVCEHLSYRCGNTTVLFRWWGNIANDRYKKIYCDCICVMWHYNSLIPWVSF